ncbi:3-oxoacyl-ACP reductase FabG [Aquihabitans daechungensis]|uniref:3-oxoacyl-ACP reductase FabG n=1 Tax=Aquihabitans daechungensis TaxID=1052257 RepID=UPI003BA31487
MSAPRVALVTGASRGIGAATACDLAADGHRVAIGYRSDAPAAVEVRRSIEAAGGSAMTVPIDVADPESVDAAVGEVEQAWGRITVLVSNAGITDDGLFIRMEAERWHHVVRTNLDGAFHVARRISPGMVRERWGRIVTVSSVVAHLGSAGQANYAASKAGVGLTRSLARELGARNITANVVAPGPIATEMLAAAGDGRVDDLAALVPAARLGEPRDVAAAVAFLCSEQAAFINGAVLPVDGGLGMGH